MKPEIEAKFLNVDFDMVRAKLRSLGAECVAPKRLMRRRNYDFPDKHLENDRSAWVRVRDEGDKITLSYKQLDSRTAHGTKEITLTVDSFEAADAFLLQLGLEQNSYQETRRESWQLGDIEIELDEWPWVKPYVEIEASSEVDLFLVAEKLGFIKEDAFFGSVEIVYQQEYDVTEAEVDAWPEITFVETPSWLEAKRI